MASVWAELRRRNVVKVAVAYAIVGWEIHFNQYLGGIHVSKENVNQLVINRIDADGMRHFNGGRQTQYPGFMG